MEQRWVARWTTPNGMPQKFFFYSTSGRMIARVDLMLKLMEMEMPRPNEYELEEARGALPAIPRPMDLGGYV